MTAATDRTRWAALVVLCVGMLMIVLDATIVNVALPSIQDDLDFSQSSLAWVVNAYLIAFGGLLLLAGRLGDLIGRRKMFLIGLAVFTGASLLCAVAQTQAMLIGARFLQGAGGAMTSAVILGMIVTMFREPREQAKAIGVYSFVASAGGSIGLLLGGVLTEAINWHWIFFVNLPIGLATGLFALRLVEQDEGIGFSEGADVRGALYLQRVLGYDALEVGLAFLPTTIVIGTLSLGFSERLNMRFGPRATLVPALLLIAAALLLFARIPVNATYVIDVLPSMLLLGAGAGAGLRPPERGGGPQTPSIRATMRSMTRVGSSADAGARSFASRPTR